jgi:hypothetical protein
LLHEACSGRLHTAPKTVPFPRCTDAVWNVSTRRSFSFSLNFFMRSSWHRMMIAVDEKPPAPSRQLQ